MKSDSEKIAFFSQIPVMIIQQIKVYIPEAVRAAESTIAKQRYVCIIQDQALALDSIAVTAG